VSVVVPVYNEQECLDRLWERLHPVLRTLGWSFEVLFVDDGSRDRSLERLLALRSRHDEIRILRFAANRGQSAALDAGFRAARGEWILTLDADLQNPPEEIPRLVEACEEVDLVFGRRRSRRDRWLRRVSSRIGNAVRNAITGHRVEDTGCSLKLLRRRAVLRLPAFKGMHRFLPSLFAFHGLRIREIAVEHEPRFQGSSKYGIGNRLWTGLIDCLGVRWIRSRAIRYDVTEVWGDADTRRGRDGPAP
jgi:dolichol-phosphate mannosyltransferase